MLRALPRVEGRRAHLDAPWVRNAVTGHTHPPPRASIVAVIAACALIGLPLLGLALRAPWSTILDQISRPEVFRALWLSIECSVAATALSFVIGLPLAVWMASETSRWTNVVRAFVLLPMVLPPVVGGLALLLAFGRNGVFGQYLDAWFGITLPFSTAGVIVAETWVALPFFVLTTESGLRATDTRAADAAATLGAKPWRILTTITLPMIAPSLQAASILAWARALGEFGATITFAGNLESTTRTMPLAVYTALESSPEAAITLSFVLIAIAMAVLFVLRKRWFPTGRTAR
ncbi:MAG: molybdate ABC transporter permease subunit [Planctomycetes bacterium]|nr:molybdate ABC transporter permease subunit [Planctomycetota bacterium]